MKTSVEWLKRALPRKESWNDVKDGATNTKTQRKAVNKYLKRIGKKAKLDLSLDSFGYCYIPFKKFLIIVSVPDDGSGLMHFQSMIFDLDSTQGISKVHKRVAAANLTELRLGEKGSFLAMNGDEISLCLSTKLNGMRFGQMLACLEDFMHTASDTNSRLEAIR